MEARHRQDGAAEEDKDVAEITGLMRRAGNWPGGLRWIARRVKPSRRQMPEPDRLREEDRLAVLHHLHEHPGRRDRRRPGSHHPQYIDVVHREHAVVETGGVRTAKAMGLRNLPSKTWQVNCGWVIAANIAADLAAWTRLLGHCDDPDLRDADPDTLRYRVWHIPARLARHARERVLKISPDWPWKDASSPAGSGSAPCPHPPDQHQPAPATRKEAPPGAVGAGAHPGTPGRATRPPPRKPTPDPKPGTSTTSNRTSRPLND